MDRPVVWKASEKQGLLLACDDFEVLYGGAAGGGKSDALLIDAWCPLQNGPLNQNHRAVIFRKNFPDLKDLINRANELFPQFIPGAKYNKSDHIWTAPSGATLEFAYLENDRDRFKYRGRAWNYIGFDELTLWATDKCWVYLSSRCRTTDPTLPTYLRATTNPDGPGQRWVMERWAIKPEGQATVQRTMEEFEVEQPDGSFAIEQREFVRRFIPARLEDNRHLRGKGYRETLMRLPNEEREALLKGLWKGNRVEGAIYLREMATLRQESRIKRLPILVDVPVNTFWDRGWNDANAIWCHQYAALENRFLHCHQQSGLTLQARVAYLQQWASENGIVYGTHYLPHDCEHATAQTGKSDVQLLRENWPGQRFVIVPRTPSLFTAITAQCRPAFANCYFDEEECADGIAALDAYRWEWNERQQVFTDTPFHGPESNYADAFRQFAQGYAPKQQRIRTPDSPDPRERRRSRQSRGTWRSA